MFYSVPCSITIRLRVLYASFSLNFIAALRGWYYYYYYAHFKHVDIVTLSKLVKWLVQEITELEIDRAGILLMQKLPEETAN